MPQVMLKRDWPGSFRRTVTTKIKGRDFTKALEFSPGVAVELTVAEVEAVRGDIGVSLLPIDMDAKNRPRIISDDVEPVEGELNESQSTD